MKRSALTVLQILICCAAFGQEPASLGSESAKTKKATDPLGKTDSSWRFKASPIFVWAPIFVAEAEDPQGGPPAEIDRPAPWLSSALFFRFGLERSGWSLDTDMLYASIKGEEEEIQNQSIRFDVVQFQIWAGRRVFRSVYVFGRARRYSAKFTYNSDDVPKTVACNR